MYKNLAILIVAVVLVGGAWLVLKGNSAGISPEESPEEVSYMNASAADIVVSSPKAGDSVRATFTVSGQAKGPWYFEASFPIEVLDKNGVSLVQTHAEAKSDWMTTEFVPFSVAITVPNYTGPATVVLKNDNPSGDPVRDKSVSFPVTIQ